jgi:Domain of unknown function (DUF4412)
VKYRWWEAVGAAILLVLVSTGRLFAGVVMTETSFAESPNGEISSQDKTIYVQGNKQKIERGSIAQITDLDKSIIYMINKHDRVYMEMPLPALNSSPLDSRQGETILKKTGKIRVIANHSCNEYRRIEKNKLERVTLNVCVSTDAPGAKELAEFDRNMDTRLNGRKFERSVKNDAAGLILEKQSVRSFRVLDPSRGKAYQTASLLAETRVNKILLQPLPPETFNPPTGYSKLHIQQHTMAPSDSPDAPD